MENKQIINGLLWKGLERFGVLGTQFVIQVILARMLDPESYGLLAIMLVFISIANILVQNGFNTALIQNKDVSENDYSSVLWMSLSIALGIYIVIFFAAPWIGQLYNNSGIVKPLRILAIMLFPGALNSVQLAKITREMEFRKIFISNLIGAVVSGIVGIIMAYCGTGLYALVAQSMVNVSVVCVVMWITSGLRLHLYMDVKRVKVFLTFGWKLAVSSILNTVTENIRSMAIGVKFDTKMLGYYERGMQFPQYGINVVQGTVQSVLLPAMSKQQENRTKARMIMKNAISLSTYLIFPMMAGMAAVSKPFVGLLLTEKWLESVKYMQIYCFVFAFYPIHVTNLQAMNSIGRSDLYLRLEVIKQIYGLIVLGMMLILAKTPIYIALSSMCLVPIGWFTNAYYNGKLIDYGFKQQVIDVFPSFLLSLIMFGCVAIINKLGFSYIVTILIQIPVGVLIYLVLSKISKNKNYKMILGFLSKMRKNRE